MEKTRKKKAFTVLMVLCLVAVMIPMTSLKTQAATEITKVVLTGVTEPKAGQEPVWKATIPANAPYRMATDEEMAEYVCEEGESQNGLVWERYDTKIKAWVPMLPGETFQSGGEYFIGTILVPKDGYTFSSNTTCTVNGVKGEAFVADDGIFQVSSQNYSIDAGTQGILSVDLTAPSRLFAGEPLPYTASVPEGANYHVVTNQELQSETIPDWNICKNGVIWKEIRPTWNKPVDPNAGVTVKADAKYQCEILLKANDGYKFSSGLIVRVNGQIISGEIKTDTVGNEYLLVTCPSKNSVITAEASKPEVQYMTHIQIYGWEKTWKKDGEMSGTSGESKRLESIKLQLGNTSLEGSIEYRTHIQDYGWEKTWKKDGEMSGTSGESKRLEAIQIRLTGEMAEKYDVFYRVHAQQFGWLDWARNGAEAGTAGYSYRLEAIQVVLVPKGSLAPGNIAIPYREPQVAYSTHVQNIGWQIPVMDGATAGTSGQSKRLEAIKIQLKNPEYSGNIEYRTHIQMLGWEKTWKKNGAMSGTSGKSYRLEAIQIKLTGEMAENYDVYYRVHAQQFGWMGWAKNGESAGTAGYSYRLEAIQVILVPKGDSAPGSTANCFRQK